MLRDAHRLAQRLRRARGARDRKQLVAQVEAAEQRVARRAASVPKIEYPPELPVSQRRDEIAAAIRDHQVVIVAGETGSGKTTQLPKICLELGRGVRGAIGHTQPRRLAARTVAARIADELHTDIGKTVGFKVRFTDRAGEHTLVKLMTDGILLAEIATDPQLRQYDTIIIDEAHERSLNIDFLLGYLKRLLPGRPDLKVIITSATIDPERFAEHFDGAPVVEVSGRTYPVEVRYRPYGVDDDRDQTEAICDAVRELRAEGPGDVLVFLSGEQEIRDTRDALAALDLPDTELLPLYARLSTAEQHRIFQPHRGRRIVLATNVAETSLTVPGIHYVIDPGTARISRYSNRLKVQRLPIERISQASANQRAGRCGRTADGVAVRLYAEDDFAARPEFTDPEILRTNLASVILQLAAAGLGDVEAFPFVDPPDRRAVRDGVALLRELGALDAAEKLTDTGRTLARLPVDPRIARMLVQADREGSLREVLVIASALSIQDVRERPEDNRQQADASHARFADPTSDFRTVLNLWRHITEAQRGRSSSAFRRMCRTEYLHYLRVREWQDLHGQLGQIARDLGMTPNQTEADPQNIHTALLAGLLSQIGLYESDKREYLGARGARFAIFPGSALFRKPPRWVVAAELVETSRLWGRMCARIEPEWVEPLAEHLVKRSHSEPHWSRKRGAVVATERVTLYGVPLVTGRTVNYSAIEPELCRELFIRHGLVEGDWDTRHRFLARNRAMIADVEELEDRARRRDILVDEQTLFDFYDARIPESVVSARHFDAWWRQTSRAEPDRLTFTPELLVNPAADAVDAAEYPDELHRDGLTLPLSYAFEPGTEADGVTVDVPLAQLNQVDAEDFSWPVPGLRQELVVALIRSLPKALRRDFVPVPDTARAVLAELGPANGPLPAAVAHALGVDPDAWDLDRVPAHLKPRFRVLDQSGEPLAEGADLDELKRRLAPQQRAVLTRAADGIEADGLRDWTIDALPRVVERDGVRAYPALVDRGDTVAVRLLGTPAEQRAAMTAGTRRLLLLAVPSPAKSAVRSLGNRAKLTLSTNPHGGVAALLDDVLGAAADAVIADAGGPAWDVDGFAALREAARTQLGERTVEVLAEVERIVAAWQRVSGRLDGTQPRPAEADMRAQLDALVYPGFVTATGAARLPDLTRYLRGIELRLDKLPGRVQRDADWMRQVHDVADAAAALPSGEATERIRWMIEELRISLFAQELRTAHPVSPKRILRAIDDLR